MTTTDKRPELPEPLPCPFCGGKAQLCTNHWPGRADMHWVQCVNENCCGHPGGGLAHGVAMGILAVVAWNERDPAILALERERDELRAMLFGCRAMLDSLRTGPDGTKYDFAQTRSGSRLNVRTVIDAIDAAMREGGDG